MIEALKVRPQETLREVFEFLEVDPNFQDACFGRASKTMPSVQRRRRSPLKSWWRWRNLSGVYWAERNLPWLFGPQLEKPELPPELYARLHRLLAADTRRLEALSGYALARLHWQAVAPEPARAARELESA